MISWVSLQFVLFLILDHVFRSPTAGFHFNSFLRCFERCYRFALIAVEGKLIITARHFRFFRNYADISCAFVSICSLIVQASCWTCFALSFYNCEGISESREMMELFSTPPIWSHRSLNCFAFHCKFFNVFQFDANCNPHNRSKKFPFTLLFDISALFMKHRFNARGNALINLFIRFRYVSIRLALMTSVFEIKDDEEARKFDTSIKQH